MQSATVVFIRRVDSQSNAAILTLKGGLVNPFEIKDCALLTRMSGLAPAVSLRELRERIAVCSGSSLYHHFCETPLVPLFDNPDYRNDFAVWVKLELGDRVLAERLGMIDPYSCTSMEELRTLLLDLIDERLSESPQLLPVLPGSEFYFKEATTVVFDTSERVASPERLADAVRRMTTSSIYFHILEARRRLPDGCDDLSAWLSEWGDDWRWMADALGSIDVYFFSLVDLRRELVRVLAREGEEA
jgi:Family of unknown function (DUF5752)